MRIKLASVLIAASLWSSPAKAGMWELYGDWDQCVEHKKSIQEYAKFHSKWRQEYLGGSCGVGSTKIERTKAMVFYCRDPEAHLTLLFFSTKAQCERVRAHMQELRGPETIQTWLDTMHSIKSSIRDSMP